MKNFKYAALVALLAASMTAGCKNNSWNPFRKKTPPPAPVDLATMDNTDMGSDAIRPTTLDTGSTPVQPETVAISSNTGDGTITSFPDTTTTPPPATGGGTSYVVRKGDTLWRIAVNHLGDGQRYRDILAANPGLDARKLAVGQSIKIPPR